MSTEMSTVSTAESGEFLQTPPDLSASIQTATPESPSVSTSVKPQVLPFVYIQTQSKLSFPVTKPNTNNMIVNTVPQLQFATLPTTMKSVQNRTIQNQGVILTSVKNVGKTQQLVLTKPANMQLPVVPVSVSSANKITAAYLTMLKPLAKITESSSDCNNSTSVIQSTNQKYVMAPVPKLMKNRLPVTVTTNTIQPKIAFMPLTIPPSNSETQSSSNNSKMFNFTITDGQVQQHQNEVNISKEESPPSAFNNDNLLLDSQLKCDEVIDLNSPVKSEDNKEYELSIAEDSDASKTDSVSVNNNIISETPLEKKKDFPKYLKHGISILKKNYNNHHQQGDKLRNLINSSSNVNNLVVDCDVEMTPVCSKPQKTERRRKSNFSYRKDYDDEVLPVEKTEEPEHKSEDSSNNNCVKEEIKKEGDNDIENENENGEDKKADINMNDDSELKNMLTWEEGIGTLPGSNLKFIVNEFNLLEYVTKDEYKKICEAKLLEKENKSNIKESSKVKSALSEFQEELRCLECGCYGLPSEFINPKYCSLDCQESGTSKELREKEMRLKRKRKRGFNLKKSSSDDLKLDKNHDQSGSEEEDTSNENSQDKYLYPWNCAKKGFSWTKYLDHIKAKAAPVKLFKDPFPYNRNGFRPGMKLEGIDPCHPSYFCVLTVSEICGYRVRLHFDGYPDNYDFWLNADSMDIFPAGWCEKHGHVLQPPPGNSVENFNWVYYLKQTKATAAPKHLFANRAGNSICPNGFRVGMKLEAVDRKNTSLVCVATVKDMMDSRILIHFDSWDDIYDYWADPTSPYIHPVGWCDQYGHSLTPPNETFSWAKYLKETKSVAAPVRAFKQRPACGFKRGMRLECVDRRVPQLIRVATVDEVKEHQLRIHFDGWRDVYSYWVDDDSENIHPVGWCQKTGHPLETPLTPDDIYDFLECPTVGCRGMGHIQGPKYATHSEQKDCPYAEDNIDIERVLPDRLLTPDKHIEAVVPISREPRDKTKPKIGRPPKFARLDSLKSDPDDDCTKKPKRKYKKRLKVAVEEDNNNITPKKIEIFNNLIEESKVEPACKEVWSKHSQFLSRYVKNIDDPREWADDDVADFVSTIPGCDDYSDKFKFLEVDGEALLSLNQRDIIDILHIKVGPAVKLYNAILLLRAKVTSNAFS